MVLAKRIIPCLDVKSGRVVKGVNFVNIRDAGDPVELAIRYDEEGADELTFLDITASSDKRDILIDMVKRTAEVIFIPFTVGGGIRTVEDFRKILRAGADKCSINTAAVNNPNLINEASKIFGAQCVVTAIDVKRRYVNNNRDKTSNITRKLEEKNTVNDKEDNINLSNTNINQGNMNINNDNKNLNQDNRNIIKLQDGRSCWWEVVIHGGRTPTGIDAISWGIEVENRGSGEILLTSMDTDGIMSGYDIELTREFSERLKIPIIASGGAGNEKHIFDVFEKGKADAALAASIFHDIDQPYHRTIRQVKEFLQKNGIPVRMI